MEETSTTILKIAQELKSVFPWGHPDFIPRMLEIIELHALKNFDYAHGGNPLGNFTRTAAIMQLYPKFPWATDYGCATVQMLKQLDAFLWQAQDPHFAPKVEGGDARLRDVTVFAQLISIMVAARPKGPCKDGLWHTTTMQKDNRKVCIHCGVQVQ